MPSTFAAKSKAQGLLYALSTRDPGELVRSLTLRPIENVTCWSGSASTESGAAGRVPGRRAGSRGVCAACQARRGQDCWRHSSPCEAVLIGALAPDVPVYGQEGRYVLPLLALFFVVAATGLSALARLSRPAGR